MEYEAVIGLETHVQLKTKSKMWCGCANAFGAPPNTNVCPVCLGLPGVLPVAQRGGPAPDRPHRLLLNCEIPRFAKFDRKNYFYPDMPKNYQITQYDKPSTANGYVEFEFDGRHSRACASPARTSRRTWARASISTATAAWISTAPACRCWRSSPSRTSPAPTWPTNISTRSRTSSSTAASAIATWRRAWSAAT